MKKYAFAYNTFGNEKIFELDAMRSRYPQNCGLVLDKHVNGRPIYLFVEFF